MIDLGDVVPLSVQITDDAGAPADATAVTVSVTAPGGTVTAPAVVNAATGTYTATYTPSAVGVYAVKWTATGVNACVSTDVFTVSDYTAGVISLAEAKAHLNISTPASDAELRDFIEVATAAAEQVSGRALAPRTVVETTQGNGAGALIVATPPVASVESVTEHGVSVPADNYRIIANGQLLERISGAWSSAANSIVVTYTAGVTGSDLAVTKHAVKEMLRHLWVTQRGGGRPARDGEMMVGAGYSFPNRVLQLLGLDSPGGFA